MKTYSFKKGPPLKIVFYQGQMTFEHSPVFAAGGEFTTELLKWLEAYGERRPPAPPSLPIETCTPFTKRVLAELCRIPFGQTKSYADLASSLGTPRGARAAGSACGRNPFPLFIPCHRILRQGGELGGFSAGLPFKKILLNFEASYGNES